MQFSAVYYLSDLSEYSNFALRSLAEKSPLSSRIIVVPMEDMHYTTDEDIEDTFGATSSYSFDGIHPKGRLGGQRYNDCLIAAVRTAGIASRERGQRQRQERGQRQEEQGAPTSNSFDVLN